jgi:hypothetical protein
MSQENVENLRAVLEALNLAAWSRGESDRSLLDPKVTYEDTTLPDHVGETYRGHEGVARATERWLEPYEGSRLTWSKSSAQVTASSLSTESEGGRGTPASTPKGPSPTSGRSETERSFTSGRIETPRKPSKPSAYRSKKLAPPNAPVRLPE